MNSKIVIKRNVLSTEMAVLINDEFVRYYIDSILDDNLQNRIVVGQVKQVVKNLKAAFIDYGADKNGMLHFKQIPEAYLSKLQQGYCLPVQIIKQNIGEKGHKLTSKLNITGKYLVCLPFEPGIHVSKKITQSTTRAKIKQALETEIKSPYGFIVRTHAAEVSLDAVIEDAISLIQKVDELLASSHYLTKGNILYEEISPIEQMVLEYTIKSDFINIVSNDEELLNRLNKVTNAYKDKHEILFNYYSEPQTIFSVYGLHKKVDQLTKRKIWLKNGGNLMIDYTEAMTIIDVNSAKAVLTKNAEKAAVELNKEATHEVILQMQRRNLSGMIIVDLVEMKDPTHKQEIYEYAKELLLCYNDSLTKVYPLTELGLLQFSRTKKYQCIPHQLLEACTVCHRPYTKESDLMALMKLEEQLKVIKLEEEKQFVQIQVTSELYEIIENYEIIPRLEAHYAVQIQISRLESHEKAKLLCQFYKR